MNFRTTVKAGGKTATGIPVPADVVDALGSGKHKLRWVLSIEEAKTPETRQRRIDKSVATLHEQRK